MTGPIFAVVIWCAVQIRHLQYFRTFKEEGAFQAAFRGGAGEEGMLGMVGFGRLGTDKLVLLSRNIMIVCTLKPSTNAP